MSYKRFEDEKIEPLEVSEPGVTLTPIDLQEAEEHGKAQRISKRKDNPEQQTKSVCKCCDMPTDNERFPVFCDLHDLYPLGFAMPLYFSFFRAALGFMLLLLVTSGFWNVVLNYMGDNCQHAQTYTDNVYYCYYSAISVMSMPNILNDNGYSSYYVQKILNTVTVILSIIYVEYTSIRLRKRQAEIDHANVVPSDFAVEVSNLPLYPVGNLEKNVKDSF